jgi:ribosomal protein S18 acetylase RimI-like enzyme
MYGFASSSTDERGAGQARTRNPRARLRRRFAARRERAEKPAIRRPMKIDYRTLNYRDSSEIRAFVTLLYDISAELDPYHFEKSAEFIDRAVLKARRDENPSNTFAGMALAGREIVGVHVLRRVEEGARIGAHVSGLWVAQAQRRRGVARRLKALGEAWARSIGAAFLSSNVLVHNAPMLELNRALGFEPYRINLRKRL